MLLLDISVEANADGRLVRMSNPRRLLLANDMGLVLVVGLSLPATNRPVVLRCSSAAHHDETLEPPAKAHTLGAWSSWASARCRCRHGTTWFACDRKHCPSPIWVCRDWRPRGDRPPARPYGLLDSRPIRRWTERWGPGQSFAANADRPVNLQTTQVVQPSIDESVSQGSADTST